MSETPITALVLMSMKYQLNFSNYDHIMFWAVCCLPFFGFLRCSDFTVLSSGFLPDTHLTLSDVLTDKIHILIYLHLRGQKNGPMFIFKDGSR